MKGTSERNGSGKPERKGREVVIRLGRCRNKKEEEDDEKTREKRRRRRRRRRTTTTITTTITITKPAIINSRR